MDNFIRQMQDRVDTMSEDHIVFLFVPEMLAMKELAEKDRKFEKIAAIDEVLNYAKTKVELDNFKIFQDIYNPKLVVPSPSDIINNKSPNGIPNN